MTKMRLVLALTLIGLLAFGAGLGTYAWFTSQATSTDNVFETGTLEINTDGVVVTPPADIAHLQPGGSRSFDFDVVNSGSLNLKYRIKLVDVSGDLATGTNGLTVSLNNGTAVTLQNGMYVLDTAELAAGAAAVPCTLTFALPTAADNFYQGKDCHFKVQLEAIQTDADWSNYSWPNDSTITTP